MGRCGCAEYQYHSKLKADDGWYAVAIYPGCCDCDTPCGVIVDWYADGEWFLEDVPEAPRGAPDTLTIPIVNGRELAKRVRGLAKDYLDQIDDELCSEVESAVHEAARRATTEEPGEGEGE